MGPVWRLHSGCEARADEDDGAGWFLVVSLLLSLQAAGGFAVQAADLGHERGADGGALRRSVARVLCTPSVDVLERVACTVETPQGKAQVHPSSVNRNLQTHGWLLYQEKVKYTKIYLRDTTLMSPFPMLFGGVDIQHRGLYITLDGWIHFQAPVRIGVIFKHLRKLMDSLLEKKLENPRMNLEGERTIQIILDLIKSEHAV
ncbi:ATP-dependent RNA helicase Dhx29-like protein [Lates japonicus]|uniref:RNA helicase n=1 Tax=Lates japonicus TaxID=270547 RepID=A0AAD3R363_LATJO|nr:ATP-dependent RNA helicase Dhx29-like protein [Lates japonicus]